MIKKINSPLRVAVIGAGIRGTNLARRLSMSGSEAVISAVAEPDDEKRRSFANEFNLAEEVIFTGWTDLTQKMSGCDAAIIATLDNQHTGPAVACLNRDWHILLEKPLADSFKDCKLIVKTQKERRRIVAVCHTLGFHHSGH